MKRALPFALILAGCVDLDAPYTCTSDALCVHDGVDGTCEPDAYCSFPVDTSVCASGKRYGELAASGIASTCVAYAPTHIAAPMGQGGTIAYAIASATIDTGALTITRDDAAALPAGVFFTLEPALDGSGSDIAVLHALELSITGAVKVTGTHALLLWADEDVSISGSIDASAHLAIPGPGGFSTSSGPGKGVDDVAINETPSGAGFAGSGGNGIGKKLALMTSAMITQGGAPYGDAKQSSLLGGSGGGSATSTAGQGTGGAGGGAIQVSAARSITLAASGVINAGGGGGGGPSTMKNGGAGGSGGSIYLEAPSVVLDVGSVVAANGGAGSGGYATGEDGRASATPAMSIPNGSTACGTGSAGGAGTSLDGMSASFDKITGCQSAGGGAAGYVTIRTRDHSSLVGTQSPTPLVTTY